MTPAEPWARLYEDVKIQIPGVLDAVQGQVTFSLFKDFCDKTNIWQEEVPISVVPDVLRYPFSLGNYGAPNRLLLMYDPKMAAPDRHWAQGGAQMDRPGVITIRYAPSEATLWSAVIAKTPTDPAGDSRYPQIDKCDHWIVDKYREALMCGVLARLQGMPGKPYSSEKQAGRNHLFYVSERSKARGDVTKANTFNGQRWVFPQSYQTIRRGGWA